MTTSVSDAFTDRWVAIRERQAWIMAAIVAGCGLAMIAWSHLGDELIPVRDGIGYDGLHYSNWVKDPGGTIFAGDASLHRIQRIVPSLIIYCVLRPLGLNHSEDAIILAFQFFNLALLVLACFVWCSIARRLQVSQTSYWIGFLALFVNYVAAKFAFYYPVLTDTAGYVSGLLLVWCFVWRRYLAMLVLAVVTAFTWPTVYLSALVLFSLSRRSPVPKPRQWLGAIVAGVLTVAVVAFTVRAYECGRDCFNANVMAAMVGDWFPISLVIAAVWVFAATQPLFARLEVRSLFRSVHWGRLLVAVVVFIAVTVVQRMAATETDDTSQQTLQNTLFLGTSKPGVFVVAHTIYFGPAVLLAIAMWRKSTALMARWGQGLPLLMAGYTLLALTAESRVQSNAWAFFVTFMVAAIDRYSWRRVHVVVFAVLCVVVSRVWFPVTQGALTGDITKYPDQFYGMSIGWRMTQTSYAIMALATIGSAVVVGTLVYSTRRRRAQT